MAYRNINYRHITDPRVRDIFHRADLYIGDAYSMFFLPYKGWRGGGGCNFTIMLTLLCVVDGIARDIYPTEAKVDDHKKRFKKLLREKLLWGPSGKGWMELGLAAKLLYVAFRNPLVHQLGQDSPSRNPLLKEQPVIGKWGLVPPDKQNIDRIDRLKDWDLAWPTMYIRHTGSKESVKLSAAAFYWSVKRMVAELAKAAS